MPSYSNSFAPHTPFCPECGERTCKGINHRRIFSTWRDLASHLSEEEILFAVNRLEEIEGRYLELQEARERRQAATDHAKALKAIAATLTGEEVAEWKRTHAPRPVIVTVPMRSRTHHG